MLAGGPQHFAADSAAYLKTSRFSDLRLSAAGQARRIAISLQDEVTLADLAGGQVGRARADLQYRLAEATRPRSRGRAPYTDGTERMSAALRTAADLRQASGAEAGRKETELIEREGALRRMLSLLDQIVT